jgi:biofilm protein TabA
MAIFGTLEVVKQQLNNNKFNTAFEYLEKVLQNDTIENKRLLSLDIDAFEKIDLDSSNFALEQVYNTKDRNRCFFESHKQYIDVQFILEGEEIIEVINTNELEINFPFDEDMDLIKYNDTINASSIKLKKGDVVVFFPEDAHMPCLELQDKLKVVKTVVKVAI